MRTVVFSLRVETQISDTVLVRATMRSVVVSLRVEKRPLIMRSNNMKRCLLHFFYFSFFRRVVKRLATFETL